MAADDLPQVNTLEDRPSGKIDQRTIALGCNMAVDAVLAPFTFAKPGQRSVAAPPTPIAGFG